MKWEITVIENVLGHYGYICNLSRVDTGLDYHIEVYKKVFYVRGKNASRLPLGPEILYTIKRLQTAYATWTSKEIPKSELTQLLTRYFKLISYA